MVALFRRKPAFEPLSFGPDWEKTAATVAIRSGPLAGRQFNLEAQVAQTRADFTLSPVSNPQPPIPDPQSLPRSQAPDSSLVCGHCHFDRDPETGLETLFDIFVRPDFRCKGIASLLVRASFRELLSRGRQTWFAMRNLMQVDTRKPELHNVGIGLLAARLGFLPGPEFDRTLAPGRVESVAIIAGTAQSPPGLLIHLNRMPGVIVAAELEPGPGTARPRPVADVDRYRRFFSAEQLLRWARQGTWLIGNVDYLLALRNLELFCRHLAQTSEESRRFTRSLVSGAKKLGLRQRTALPS
jgi:ribosomal protein S18 acetylase RimI-like enzyme